MDCAWVTSVLKQINEKAMKNIPKALFRNNLG
jgi:hypothetical protein